MLTRSLRCTGWITLILCLQVSLACREAAAQDAAATLEIQPPDGDVSEWLDAEFQVLLIDAEGTATDVTDSLNLSWRTSCGGSFDGGTFTPPAINQSGPCEITATLNTGDGESLSDAVVVNIIVDRCRRSPACGATCGCTPGSAFGLLIGLGLIALRLLPRPRSNRRG